MQHKTPDLYQLALALTPGVDLHQLALMQEEGISPEEFFRLSLSSQVSLTEGDFRFRNSDAGGVLHTAENELKFIERHHIRAIWCDDPDYPALLAECHDAPLMIFVLGDADLNAEQPVSLVGTRRCTPYGIRFCHDFVENVSAPLSKPAIISGLAYGIDAAAHESALECNVPTFGVLAHGLDMIYPAPHRDLARKILKQGGALISEYPSHTRPFRGRFLERNRVVAGLSAATVVVESDYKGGALSTANLAFGYDREVFALPGRIGDQMSLGCNRLIYKEKAHIYSSHADFLKVMNWESEEPDSMGATSSQPNLFSNLDPNWIAILECLGDSPEPKRIDEIYATIGGSYGELMARLMDMEAEGLVLKYPGNAYAKA